jgi:opacity protein-like surface antigen
MKKHLLSLLLFFLATSVLTAQEFDPDNRAKPYLNTITTAAPFLLIAPDSRAGGMGDMGVATSADNYSQHHNPSKYVFNEDVFGIGIAYSPWLNKLVSDVHLAYLSTFWKITDNDAIAFSLRYFTLGEIQFTNKEGYALNKANPNEFALDFTYSRKLSKIVSMAVTPRFVYSNLANGFTDASSGLITKAGLAGAVDISLFVNKEFTHRSGGLQSSNLMFGFNISNIGNKVSYTETKRRDFLPCNLRLGLSYAMMFDEYNKLGINVEAGKLLVPTPTLRYKDTDNEYYYYGNGKDLNDVNPIAGIGRSFGDGAGGYKYNSKGCFNEEMREIVWTVGLEYSYRDILFVRAGSFLENKYKGNRKFATVGVGVKYSIFAIDVCYLFPFTQHHPLENTLRFSLTFMLKSFNKDAIRSQGKINR